MLVVRWRDLQSLQVIVPCTDDETRRHTIISKCTERPRHVILQCTRFSDLFTSLYWSTTQAGMAQTQLKIYENLCLHTGGTNLDFRKLQTTCLKKHCGSFIAPMLVVRYVYAPRETHIHIYTHTHTHTHTHTPRIPRAKSCKPQFVVIKFYHPGHQFLTW